MFRKPKVGCAAWAVALLLTCALVAAGCAETASSTQDGAATLDKGPRDSFLSDGFPKLDSTCATFSTEANQVPAAMMIVLDRSSSMSTNGKWQAAQKAIVEAMDKSAFDHMALGLLAYPAFQVGAPACIALLAPQVSCGVPVFPQVPLADSKNDKAVSPTGPRREIYNWLLANGPDATATDASPGYDALATAIERIKLFPVVGKRLVLLITDGGFSCTSVSKPTRPGYSDGLCPDWEEPPSVTKLLEDAHNDATKPVDTFIVGVPGSDSNGEQQGPYATAPYAMRLALSSYAKAGSPATVDPTCDGTWNKDGGDPAKPCHFDMTQGQFDSAALAKIISDIRGKALGCVYELPKVDDKNQTIDKNRVNVYVTIDSGAQLVIPRRKDPQDSCTDQPCWDYDQDGNVELLGLACQQVRGAVNVKVEVSVGCLTIIK